jgi:hypothetical protein
MEQGTGQYRKIPNSFLTLNNYRNVLAAVPVSRLHINAKVGGDIIRNYTLPELE